MVNNVYANLDSNYFIFYTGMVGNFYANLSGYLIHIL